MMIWLLFVGLAVLGAPPALAQDGPGVSAGRVLELPTVTLVGVDTLFLEPPAPRRHDELPRLELATKRRQLASTTGTRVPGGPVLAAAIGRSATGGLGTPDGVQAPPGEPYAGPLFEAGAASPQLHDPVVLPPGSPLGAAWSSLSYYVPTEVIRSTLRAVRRHGAWETAADLDLALADGWTNLSPGAASFVLGRLEGDWRGGRRAAGNAQAVEPDLPPDLPSGQGGVLGPAPEARDLRPESPLGLRLGAAMGAFLAPVAEPRYTLSLDQQLTARFGRMSLIHGTEAVGMSPGTGTLQAGLLGQRITLEAYPGEFAVHAGAAGYLKGTVDPDSGALDALVRLAAGYHAPGGVLTLAAGAAGVYRQGALDVYPEAAIQLSPWDFLRFSAGAAAFLEGTGPSGTRSLWSGGAGLFGGAGGAPVVPATPIGVLHESIAAEETGLYALGALASAAPPPVLESQSGYRLRSGLLFAPAGRVRAELAAELLFGSVYEGWEGVLELREVSRFSVLAQLSAWLLRFGGAGAGLEITVRGFAAASVPFASELLAALHGERLEGALQLAFPNSPLRLILGVLWGEIPAGLPAAAMLSPWEPFRGSALSLRADLRFGRRHGVLLGGELRRPDGTATPSVRLAAGYRYQGP